MFNIFMDMGIVNFNTSNIAKNEQLVSKHFSSIFSIRLILSFFYFTLCIMAAVFLAYNEMQIALLIPICINQILVAFILYVRSNLAGLQLFEKDSIISITDRLILIILCSLIFWSDLFDMEMGISLFIYLQTFAYAVTLILSLVLLKPKLNQIKIQFNLPFNVVVLKKSFPYALLTLLMGFYYRVDAVMLERILPNGAYEAGVYAQAYRFYEAGNMLAYLFGALLFPMFSKLIGEKKSVDELLNLSFRLLTVFAIIAGITGYFYSAEIMKLRFSSEIYSSSSAFKYLMIGFMGIAGTYVFGALLTANENLKELNIMATTGVILNVILNLILIPKYKGMGAAIASMITQLSMAIFQIILVYRKLGTWPGWMTSLKIALFIALGIFLSGWLSNLIDSRLIQIVVLGIGMILFAFIIQILSIRNVMSYMRLVRQYKSN